MKGRYLFLVVVSLLLLPRPPSADEEPCPANSILALTCENGTCDRLLGENAANCPSDCLDGRRHLKTYYGLAATCPETTIFRPATVDEARKAMRRTTRRGKRVRVVGTLHTGSKAVCVEGGNVISTQNLTRILGLETYGGQETVNVEAGAHMWDIAEYLHAHGKALGYNIPGYGDISIGGFLAVGGHGSNAQGSSTISSLVVSIDKMGPRGQITTFDAGNTSSPLWSAVRTDMGMLGMTVRVRLRVRDQFHVRQRILTFEGSELFRPGGLGAIADQCEFMFATYYRSADRLDVTCGTETSAPVTAEDARMTLFIPDVPPLFERLAIPAFQRAACDPDAGRRYERLLFEFRRTHPWLEWTAADGAAQRGREAVGYSHRMVETTFRDLDRRRFSERDWEVAIPESEMDAAMAYVKGQLDTHDLYNPSIGVVIRADRASRDTLIASSAADSRVPEGERLYHIEFPVFWPYAFSPAQLAQREAPYAGMMLYLIAHHRARPHLGKNREDVFWSAEALATSAERRALFQAFIDERDPAGTFANDFLRRAGFSWPAEAPAP
jgi:FAD/FMN-containing dehydrogenase